MRRLVVPLHAATRAAGAALNARPASSLADSRTLLRLAAACAYISGMAAAVGVVLLAAEVGILVASPEDEQTMLGLRAAHCVSVLVQYGIAIPVALALHRQNRSVGVDRSLVVTVVALIAMTNIVEVQALVLAGLLDSTERIAYLAVAFGILVVWFVAVGLLGRSSGLLTGRTSLMSLLGASYIAYPAWALWLGRQLREPVSVTDAPAT